MDQPLPLQLSSDQLERVLAEVARLSRSWLEELDGRAIPAGVSGADGETMFSVRLPERGEGLAALTALEDVLSASRAQNGRFLGYVLGSGEPVAAAADLLASVINQNAAVWRSSPAGITIEKVVVESLAAVGCDGFFRKPYRRTLGREPDGPGDGA